jgi:hypothetical protein
VNGVVHRWLDSVSKNGAGPGISLTNVAAAVTIGGGTIQNTTTGRWIDQAPGAFSYAGTISNASGGPSR